MQHGTVIQVEPDKKRFIVWIEHKNYALWECTDCADVSVGSRLKGLLYKVGPGILHNIGNGATLHAIGHTGACSAAHCRNVVV